MKLWNNSFFWQLTSPMGVLCMKVAKLEVAHRLRLSSADSRCRLVTGCPKVNFLYCFFIYFYICVFGCKIGGLLFACIPHDSDHYFCFLSKNYVEYK
jgi:hypothetical protein